MSLQLPSTINDFVQDCANIWQDWNTGVTITNGGMKPVKFCKECGSKVESVPIYCTSCGNKFDDMDVPPEVIERRKNAIKGAVEAATGFMQTPAVVFKDVGTNWGSFAPGSWTLTLNSYYLKGVNITYYAFVEYCVTMYHESRHCEQVYRIAQGMASGHLVHPYKDAFQQNSSAENLSFNTLSVKDKIAQSGKRKLPDAGNLESWLKIPAGAATHAFQNSNAFPMFLNLTRPAWFKRPSIVGEVEDWMDGILKMAKADMIEFAQKQASTAMTASDSKMRALYKAVSVENDAYGIEDAVTAQLQIRLGHGHHKEGLNKRKVRPQLL
jgi:hypothetical protein